MFTIYIFIIHNWVNNSMCANWFQIHSLIGSTDMKSRTILHERFWSEWIVEYDGCWDVISFPRVLNHRINIFKFFLYTSRFESDYVERNLYLNKSFAGGNEKITRFFDIYKCEFNICITLRDISRSVNETTRYIRLKKKLAQHPTYSRCNIFLLRLYTISSLARCLFHFLDEIRMCPLYPRWWQCAVGETRERKKRRIIKITTRETYTSF